MNLYNKIDLTAIEELIENTLTSSISFVIGALSSLPNTFIKFVIILVVSFFMLIDGEKLWQLILVKSQVTTKEQ